MCGCTLKGILASIPVRSTIFCSPDTVNGAPRSLTKMKGELASRLSARSARNSSPNNECVPVDPRKNTDSCQRWHRTAHSESPARLFMPEAQWVRGHRGPINVATLMSALGHVWTAPWQELSDVAAALVGCGHVSGLF